MSLRLALSGGLALVAVLLALRPATAARPPTPERIAKIHQVIASYEDVRSRVNASWPALCDQLPCARATRVGFVTKAAGLNDSATQVIGPLERDVYVMHQLPLYAACSVRSLSRSLALSLARVLAGPWSVEGRHSGGACRALRNVRGCHATWGRPAARVPCAMPRRGARRQHSILIRLQLVWRYTWR